jgi:hypothetical protein
MRKTTHIERCDVIRDLLIRGKSKRDDDDDDNKLNIIQYILLFAERRLTGRYPLANKLRTQYIQLGMIKKRGKV